MSVETGMYLAFGPDNTLFDRHMIEDLSLMPKIVYFRDLQMGPRPILIEKVGDGYIVKMAGAPVGLRDGQNLAAHLIDQGSPPLKFEIKRAGDGYIFSTGGKFIVKSEEQGMGGAFLAKLGDQSHAAIIKLTKGDD